MAHTTPQDTGKKSDTALREEGVLAFWKEQGIFEKSLTKDSPQGEFIFYDGPPFATGLPHWGSLLSSVTKDVMGRYKTMQGYHVERTWGWDCHGLPIEHMIEQKLGLKSKKDIETLGIDRFNEEARASVLQFADDWKTYVDRVGRWVDFDHSYKTMDNSYIESVWWALNKIHTDKRLYEGRKVLMYCPRCETPLSKAEIAMDNSYKDVTDEAVYVKFRVTSAKSLESRVSSLELPTDGPVYILAWTTTPWTLPGNVALAVGSDMSYVLAKKGTEYLFLAKERLAVLGEEVEVVREVRGRELVGLSYEPLYDIPKAKALGSDKAWTVVAADFVTTEDGTGVVHIAPMYGEDDYSLGLAHGLPVVPLLDATGTYNADAPELVRGMYFKKGGKQVMEDIETRGLLFAKHPHTHSYPHCYRCGTALIYNALTSWFIDIQSIKERLVEANEEISWYPEHLKHGRFKNNVQGAPDWTISRNRFWASPLPIWKHEKTGEVTVLGSLAELRVRTKKSGNRYIFVRHGQAESNVAHIISALPGDAHHLTEEGTEQCRRAAESLAKEGITKIIASPFVRTRESAEIIAEALGYDKTKIEIEERFQEWQLGVYNGRPLADLREFYAVYAERFTKAPEGGENLVQMKRRVGEALYELEQTYQNETILVVGHEYTVWLATCVAQGADVAGCIATRGKTEDYTKNGEVRTIDFVPLPHNADYELDLHRPYIDDLPLVAEDGARLVRIPEVVDCWMESGLMPVASEHTLGEELGKPARYPGDFIAEYIAQTRTWFYYMHAIGVLLFDGPSFKNCVTTGNVLAADGAKMSKSKKNYADPLLDMDRYGADAARLYLLGSVVMQSEDMNFREEELKEVHNRFIGILWNTYKFYEMYVDEGEKRYEVRGKSANILDEWILARLGQVTAEVTEHMNAYDTIRSVRTLRDFVTDFSTWYIRRSRDRFKSDDVADKVAAFATTRHVLLTLATLLAPIAPFIAESIYRGVGEEKESVHLTKWPQSGTIDGEVLTRMEATRTLVSEALELRAKAGVKIRQPLQSLTVPEGKEVYEELVCDELNVKEIIRGCVLALDATITPKLKQEGDIRELVRSVQDMRKKASLMPHDKVVLTVETDEAGKALLTAAQADLARVAGVAVVVCGNVADGTELSIGESASSLNIAKN